MPKNLKVKPAAKKKSTPRSARTSNETLGKRSAVASDFSTNTRIRGDLTIDRDFIGRDSNTYNTTTINITLPEPQSRQLYEPKIPPLPRDFVPRDEIYSSVRRHVLSSKSSDSSSFTILNGFGGVGKSVLASALCRDDAIRSRFSGGIFWITVGKDPKTIPDQMANIGLMLGDSSPEYYRNFDIAFTLLQRLLVNKSVLIVLDGVSLPNQLLQFQFNNPDCHFIVTTRVGKRLSYDVDARIFDIGVFREEEAIRLLESITAEENELYPQIVHRLHCHPLAIRLAGRKIQKGTDPSTWLDEYSSKLSQLKLDIDPEDPNDSLTACFNVSFKQFTETELSLFWSMGIFPEHISIPISILLPFWQKYAENSDQPKELLDRFADLELVQVDTVNATVRLLDYLHDYAEEQLGIDRPKYHDTFLSTYNTENLPWHSIKLDSYICEYLPYHLIGGGRQREVPAILDQLVQWVDGGRALPQSLPSYEALILALWSSLWNVAEDDARDFYRNRWLRNAPFNIGRKSRVSSVLAVRSAFEVNYTEGLVLALCHPEEQFRLAAVNYAFYLSNGSAGDSKERSLDVLDRLVSNILRLGFIPDISVLKSIFQLAPLLVINQYQENLPDLKFAEDVILRLKRTLQIILERSAFRLTGARARKVLIALVVNTYRGLINRAKSDTINNFDGYNLFFTRVEPTRRQITIDATSYLNNNLGKLEDLSDLMPELIKSGDRISFLVAEFILISRGIKDPARVIVILERLVAEIEDPGCVVLLAVTHIWFSVLSRLPYDEITDSHLAKLRKFVCEWLERTSSDYGAVKYNGNSYLYYPLAYYASIWTKAHPGIQVDLLTEYQQRAFRNDDKALHTHIIASFGDFRQQYWDLPTVLQILLPYLEDPSAADYAILVSSLGYLRGRYPVIMDDFLNKARAPKDLYNDIYINSYQLSLRAYVRIYQVLCDLVSFAPKSVIEAFLPILRKSLSSASIEEMFSTLVNMLVRELLETSTERNAI